MTSSPSVVNLACGELRCDLRPDLGAAIAGLWLGPVAVLRSTDALAMDNPRQGGCFPLVPFSNRIGPSVPDSLLWMFGPLRRAFFCPQLWANRTACG